MAISIPMVPYASNKGNGEKKTFFKNMYLTGTQSTAQLTLPPNEGETRQAEAMTFPLSPSLGDQPSIGPPALRAALGRGEGATE